MKTKREEFVAVARAEIGTVEGPKDNEMKEELKQFIDINNARPLPKNNKDLNSWMSKQLHNYN